MHATYHLVPGLQLLRIAHGQGVGPTVAQLARRPDVEYAMPDFQYQLSLEPDDPSYADQWALTSMGAAAAWSRSTGSQSVIVAVLDTGVDLDHPDLAANIIPGWNFVNGTDVPNDDNGHGTHVAGIIGAIGNNGTGVTGINWSVSIMPLKICDQDGSCDLSDEIAALDFAVAHGAQIANASYGGASGGWTPERDAIAAAGAAGLLFVAAAGNSHANNDMDAFYPASWPLDNVVSVAASTQDNGLASFSNFGESSVDLAAPGVNILSTLPDGYGSLDGTSMAAPQVTGAAALVKSLHPSWTPQTLRRQLIETSSPAAALVGKVASCGHLNLDAATATSTIVNASLCIVTRGTSLGTVKSSPAGINCGVTCTSWFVKDTNVTLTAVPAAGGVFDGWAGPCSGTAACVVKLSNATTVTATFVDARSQGGWTSKLLGPPSGRDPIPPGTNAEQWAGSFFKVSLSANGKWRAKTIFDAKQGWCYYASSDTGGVFLEKKTSAGWVSDGVITAPQLGTIPADRWMNCQGFGSVTALSGDGSTVLVSQTASYGWLGLYRCEAMVYRRTSTGWALDGALFPPGVDAEGTADASQCGLFGIEGVISRTGDRVAISAPRPDADRTYTSRVFVFVRGSSGWSLEQQILAPVGTGCAGPIGGTRLAMSADGATMLIGDPFCEAGVGPDTGRVYAYTRTGSLWTQPTTVASPDGASWAYWFGRYVAISADGLTAAIGVNTRVGGTPYAKATYVFEFANGQWQKRTYLAPGVPDPEDSFACTAVVRAGQRIVCASYDSHGYNAAQGSIYVFNRPLSGWASGAKKTRVFAPRGYAFERLGSGDESWRPDPAVREDGKVIDATVTPLGITLAGNRDRIGYEFRH